MNRLTRIAVGAGAILGLSAIAAPATAGAAGPPGPFFGFGASHAVFVQTDNLSGNQVVAYDRAANGTLSLGGTYNTGGAGGQLLGSAVDHTASQGSLAYDPDNALLYAVNAGSNTVSVFSAHGDDLSLRQVIGSGGVFPVSVAVHGNLVYVLNALNGGSVQGFVNFFGHLFPLPGSYRNLHLAIPSNENQFVSTPGQVAFSPDGSQLVVTTKASGNSIDVFRVGGFGELSPSPVINVQPPSTVPFAITFDAGHLVIANAGPSTVSTFTLNADGTLGLLDAVGTGAAATCWVTAAQGYLYASNAGSATVSGIQPAANGQLTLLSPATGTDPGTVDASTSLGGQYLYVQTGGNGIVDEFQVNANGSLLEIGHVTVAGAAGGEGIVAF
jgi:DNA-binding beta-propeller fold protein YncE